MQEYGAPEKQSEILVELPGVDDPARVKELIGSAAQLKIVEVKNEGPWKTQGRSAGREGRHSAASDTEAARLARRRRQRIRRLVSGDPHAR